MKFTYLPILLITCLLTACEVSVDSSSSGTVAAAGHSPMDVRGQAKIEVNGQTYNITSSYYLGLKDGLQFTMEMPWENEAKVEELSQEQVLEMARPVIQHAYDNKLYARTKFTKSGEEQSDGKVQYIGVALYQKAGMSTSGRRVRLSIAEIESQ